jgi:hypothetical protein
MTEEDILAANANQGPRGVVEQHGAFAVYGADNLAVIRRRGDGVAVHSTLAQDPSSLDVEMGPRGNEELQASTDLPVAHMVTSETEGRRKEPNRCCIPACCLAFVLVVGAVLGGVCGSGLCSPEEPKSSTPATPPSQEEQPSSYKAFNSTDELYQAVDIYLLSLTEDPRESIVARTYGYPIGTWDVSRIKNFSEVFISAGVEPSRGSQYDQLRPPMNFSNFNEDISGWNVSAAVTMKSMFWACNRCTLTD